MQVQTPAPSKGLPVLAHSGPEAPLPAGEPSLSGTSPFSNEQAQGKGDLFGPPSQQSNPNFDLVGPMTTQQGYQQLAAEMNAQQQQQQGYQQLAEQMNAQQNQQSMVEAQERGEQGRGPAQDPFDSRFSAETPNQTVQSAFDALAGKGPGLTQADFDSRFGDPNQFAPTYGPRNSAHATRSLRLAVW